MLSTILGLLGLAAMTAAAALVAPVAGLATFGVSLLWVAHRMERAS